MDARAYLNRIGYSGPTEPTWETLRSLHRAHLLTVPFENLDIHSGRPIVLAEAALYRKIVEERRGGFCYELNGLFAWLLRQLGFGVTLLSAGVARAGGDFGPEFDHLLLRVDLERPWLADVGFGEGFRDPVPLAHGGGDSYHARHESGWWIVYRGDAPQFRFTLDSHELADFTERCRFHQTSPESSFTRERITTLALPDGRITLSGRQLIRTRGGARTEEELTPAQCTDALRREFGIVLPLVIVPMSAGDWDEVRRIYAEGIATGQATFETEAPDWEDWDRGHLAHPRLLAREGGTVAGWAALSAVSKRPVYRGVAEVSVYVAEGYRGRGVGAELLRALIEESERSGFWTLQSSIFPENEASARLHRRFGFREVGRRERIGRHQGRWRDTVLLERRSQDAGTD